MKYFLNLLILLIFISPNNILAQKIVPMDPIMETYSKSLPPDNIENITSLFGDDHKYSVYYKDDGQAVVLFVHTMSNSGDKPLNEIKLQSKNKIFTPSVFQIIREPVCAEYDYRNQSVSEPKCLRYTEPDYFQFWSEKIQYLKGDVKVEDNNLIVKLPQAIETNKAGSYILAYSLNNTVKNRFGNGKSFIFNSLISDKSTQNLSLGINSQTQKVFKDAPYMGEVYQRNDFFIFQSAQNIGYSKFRSTQLDQVVNSVGYGMITKNASFLNPGEIYSYEGVYANNYISLYMPEILVALGILIGTALLLIGIFLLIYKTKKSNNNPPSTESLKIKQISLKSLSLYAFLSFVIAASITVITVLLYFVRNWLDMWGFYNFTSFAVLILTVKATVLFIIFYFVPIIYIYLKKGLKKTLIYILFLTLWTILIVTIVIVIFSNFLKPNFVQIPVPLDYPSYNTEYKNQPYIDQTSASFVETEELQIIKEE